MRSHGQSSTSPRRRAPASPCDKLAVWPKAVALSETGETHSVLAHFTGQADADPGEPAIGEGAPSPRILSRPPPWKLSALLREGLATLKADQALVESERRFRLLFESVTDYAIHMLDRDGTIVSWNRGGQKLKGYSAEEIIGKRFDVFFTPEDREAQAPQRALAAAARDGRFEHQGWRLRKDGSRFWANAVIDAVRDENGELIGFAKITRDFTERRRHERRLCRLAHCDALTGLPNRAALLAKLKKLLRSGQPATVFILDLDDFKDVNDTLGHMVGDTILKAAARRIRKCVGSAGSVGRLGGDEFVVILPDLGSENAVLERGRQLIDAFRAPFRTGDVESFLGLSVGAVTASGRNGSADEILSNADLALYRAKAEGRNTVSLFRPGLRQSAVARGKCERELRNAVERGELEPFFQPQVQLADRRVVGAESLLRWRHPERGVLTPEKFLPVLERGPLAATVGDWAIGAACTQAARIRRSGREKFRVAVNLFGAQFRSGNLVATVMRALEENALSPDALELEITENLILQHDDSMVAPLRDLRARGVGVAFDDYGTGYASLSLLKRYPLSRLKIDRSFVKDLCTRPQDRALVKAVVFLAENFGLDVIAEGVETEEQASVLASLGCRLAQGFLYSPAVVAAQLLETMARRPAEAAAA